ncbi:hypothetical protein [Microbulbifer hydrolyticus]|uniref:DNA breaking-rejoining protein n=1 Tax=Microbulbifer hydrolyticus TaxID=48074 RepID=A0A6P1T9K2_9GAMM|nr:hypothetical protein [Microbulbifer hydrolyticus]MBB5210011.1 hypothetical protein [Microbulbifer hydrolyticus]QHQ39464.1 hypothetical protein GTQ55_11040 [Microbulbifer hydrolyticus]
MQTSHRLAFSLLSPLLLPLLFSAPVTAAPDENTHHPVLAATQHLAVSNKVQATQNLTGLDAQQRRVQLREESPTPENDAASRSHSARITATINGYQAIEYLIDAKTGQSLELDVHSSNTSAGYRITAPAAPRALYKGHGQHSRFSVTLPRDGTYRVLIYLMRNAAQKGESADFALDIRLRNPG